MEFLNQARLAQPWLADDQHQLPVALARPFPAPHQEGYLLVAANERGEMALAPSASAATGAYDPVQRYRLGHTFEFVAAAILGDKETGDLALHSRGHDDRTRLRYCLRSRGDVRHVAEYLTRRVDHHRSKVDGDACREAWPAGALVLAVQFGERPLGRKRCPHRALSIVLQRHGVAE
jgi:hypothetical protein